MKRVLATVAVLTLVVSALAGAQQLPSVVLSDTALDVPGPVLHPTGVTHVVADVDTVRKRARAVDVSDAYLMRLKIHWYASYATVPLFVLQSVAGNQLFQADKSGAERPGWAKTVHSGGALGLSALFGINTVTGVWNLWESRENEAGRTKRLLHSALMLASDAGFAYTGLKLADDAKHSVDGREDHRNLAYYSMGAALAGYGLMLLPDR
jgi:hypothetical protein